MDKTTIFWFRRDLRLNDNTGLLAALSEQENVQPLFIFDSTILDDLPKDDARVTFIWDSLKAINTELKKHGASLLIKQGDPVEVWKQLIEEMDIVNVYTNRDYEPKAVDRDNKVRFILESNAIGFFNYKDHVFFEKDDVLKDDGTPYTVYTPYKNKWLKKFEHTKIGIPKEDPELMKNYAQARHPFPTLQKIGFKRSSINEPKYNLKGIEKYDQHRDIPAKDLTTRVGHHLRFGTISVRSLIYYSNPRNKTYLSEIIWRDFFAQILHHFPHVVNEPFKKKYTGIEWRNNEAEFEKWCKGETGYPMVDAGMRQLNQTGFMHNRVRMVTASFLVKHLLIDWRWGEAYFADKLLDFDLASNNGNWQWAAGTGCDAAPYFRVFNPTSQQEKFDPNFEYIKKWIPEYTEGYIEPMVDHKMARQRAIDTYKKALESA